jgi:hypothetical protein
MTQLRTRLAATLAGGLITALLALPGVVAATTGEPIAQTGGMSATLPLLGTSLTVDVTLDTVGNITGVALTPTGDFSATTTDDSVVKFSNTAGTTKVAVRAKGDKLSISAKSAALADFVGGGTWSADVFGTGADSSVDYTIGDDGSGNPTIALGTVTPAAGITATPGTPKMGSGDDGAFASVGVAFEQDGYVKRLRITVSVDEEGGDAHLRITLTGKDRQKLTGSLEELAGARVWSAHLCDGTPVSVAFHVESDGTVAYDGATGAPATETARGNGFQVRFDGTRVGIKVGLHLNDDGTYTLVVKGTSGKCSGDHPAGDSADSVKSGEGDHDGDHSGDHSGSGGDGDHDGGDSSGGDH